jgi:hypothetical protein
LRPYPIGGNGGNVNPFFENWSKVKYCQIEYLMDRRLESARTTANPKYRLKESLRTQLERDAERHYVDGKMTPNLTKALAEVKAFADVAIELILENAKKKLCIQLREEMEKQGIGVIMKHAHEALKDYCTRQEV